MDETQASKRAGRTPRGRRLVPGTEVTREPPKDRLSVDRIVDAAMDLMERKGYDAVSMRSLAQELDTGPASLYAHVANREHLDQLVLSRIAQQLEVPEPDPERWAEQVKELARQILELYRAHPGSARAAMALIPTESGSVQAFDGLLGLCLAGGIEPQAAAWFGDLLTEYVGAVAVEELIWTARENSTPAGEEADHAAFDRQLAEYFESLPPERFPHLTTLARVVTNGDGDDRFEFGLDVLVSGLAAVSPRYA